MKNIVSILIATVIYWTIVYFSSCKQYTNNIIQKVEVHKDSCYYKVNQYWKRDNTLCCSVYVLEPCGIYNDGDTVRNPKVAFAIDTPKIVHVNDSVFMISQHSDTINEPYIGDARAIHKHDTSDIYRYFMVGYFGTDGSTSTYGQQFFQNKKMPTQKEVLKFILEENEVSVDHKKLLILSISEFKNKEDYDKWNTKLKTVK